jgi:hypothetical protein
MEKEFKSFSEIVKDEIFIYTVGANISQLQYQRRHRSLPPMGFVYKRDWFDRMKEAGQINTFFFLNNIESIWNKKSSLSSEIREAIQHLCEIALQETLIAYSNMEEKSETLPN